MAIRFQCPQCGKLLSAPDRYADKQGKCKCGIDVIVPGNSENVKFSCPGCKNGVSLKKTQANKPARCPTCRSPISMPALGKLLDSGGASGVEKLISGPGGIRKSISGPRGGRKSILGPREGEKEGGPARGAGIISFSCPTCGGNVMARQNSAGNAMDCPSCGCYLEVPRGEKGRLGVTGGPRVELDWEAAGKALEPALEPAAETAARTGKTVCALGEKPPKAHFVPSTDTLSGTKTMTAAYINAFKASTSNTPRRCKIFC